MQRFRVDASLRRGDEAHLAVRGEITPAEGARLVLVLRALVQAGARQVFVDLAAVDACDAAVLAQLQDQQRYVEARGGWLVIDGPPSIVRGIEPTLGEIFRIHRRVTGTPARVPRQRETADTGERVPSALHG